MKENLLEKVWKQHTVETLESGLTQLFIGLHLVHEVTSPQAFQALREKKLPVMFPELTFATVDHIIPTDNLTRPFFDSTAEAMALEIEKNTREHGIEFFDMSGDDQGIVHVIGPELGLTQPGMTIACGDSHTSTHGAFGSLAFGIGTSQVKDILATQTLMLRKPKVRKIGVDGRLPVGVYPKDVILQIIKKLGVNGGIGYAYEYGGSVISDMDMEGRMTICNMSIEGGARIGYVNPDEKTFSYLKGRKYAPKDFDAGVAYWKSVASDEHAEYDDTVNLSGEEIEPMVTWGINPGQSAGISEKIPALDQLAEEDKETAAAAFKYMGFDEGNTIKGIPIDVAFIGSCTNSRISDLREGAKIVRGKKIASNVKALVVPGSKRVYNAALEEGLDKIYIDAGFEWRAPGCSMCLAMNPDKLNGREICASSSNRNFIGRQGSPTGRTLLMSPAMVAAAAITGKVADVREL